MNVKRSGSDKPLVRRRVHTEPRSSSERSSSERPSAERSSSERPAADAPARDRPSDEPAARRLNAMTAGEAGLAHIADLTKKDIEGVTSVEPDEGGWLVHVEVLEDRRVPSSGDVLAVYETKIDQEGSLLSYRRIRRYKRSNADFGEAF